MWALNTPSFAAMESVPLWRLTVAATGGQTDAVILFMRGGQAVWGEVDFTDIAVFHGQAEHRAADHAGCARDQGDAAV